MQGHRWLVRGKPKPFEALGLPYLASSSGPLRAGLLARSPPVLEIGAKRTPGLSAGGWEGTRVGAGGSAGFQPS